MKLIEHCSDSSDGAEDQGAEEALYRRLIDPLRWKLWPLPGWAGRQGGEDVKHRLSVKDRARAPETQVLPWIARFYNLTQGKWEGLVDSEDNLATK